MVRVLSRSYEWETNAYSIVETNVVQFAAFCTDVRVVEGCVTCSTLPGTGGLALAWSAGQDSVGS